MMISKLITKLILKSYGWKPTDKIVRYKNNPVLTAKDVPYEAALVFNAGVIKKGDKYYMLFRDDYKLNGSKRHLRTHVGIARSDDGINWKVDDKPFVNGRDIADGEIKRFYDPRLTVIDGEIYMTFAVDTMHGLRGGTAKIIGDFEGYEVLSMSVPDNRNMVLFPEKINGKYYRLERPMPVYSRGRELFDMWISSSYDLIHWGDSQLVIGQEKIPFSNCKIGPAAPPIKTDKGWLVTFHAVKKDARLLKNGWERRWKKVYSAGIMLLDLNNPSKVLGVCNQPLLAPEAKYELEGGFRNNAIFPCGMIDEKDGTAKIYYGAGDIVVCLATAKIDDLVDICLNKN